MGRDDVPFRRETALPRRARIAVLAVLGFASPVVAQEAGREIQRASTFPGLFFQMVPDDLAAVGPDHPMRELILQLLPFAGREDLVLELNPDAYSYDACPSLEVGESPLEKIRERARDTRIVIVNEMHDNPRHRRFVASILRTLAPEGYGYLAAETFSDAEGPEGFYIDEPLFGHELRAARALGFSLLAYPQRADQRDSTLTEPRAMIDLREESQAANLADQLAELGPDARVVVHVGSGHVFEEPFESDGAEARWFAARLKEKTGIDPLTISQTQCTGPGPESVLADGGGFVSNPAVVDLWVAHPPVTLERGRPAWRLEAGAVASEVPDALRDLESAVLIEAYGVDASDERVPADRLYLRPGERLPLLLSPGSYRLVAYTPTGPVADPVEITVTR